MNINKLIERPNISNDTKSSRIYFQFEEILKELEKKELPNNIIESINQKIQALNSIAIVDNKFSKSIKSQQTEILKLVEKELKVIPKNYYRNMWLALGMTIFGLPLGIAFGLSIGNIGLMAIGLPVGMGIGTLIGSNMDKKALGEGRQLDVEIKY